MRKSIWFPVVAAFFLIAARGPSGGADYRLLTEDAEKRVTYRANDFYSVYYLYMNVIQAVGINERIGEEEIGEIITLCIDALKKNKAVQLQIDDYHGSGTLRITVRPDIAPKGNKPVLFILSNYNAKTRRVVSGDAMKDAYGTYFYLERDKLVKYQYVHEPKTAAEIGKMSANSRADYYLLDGDAGNDRKGMKLLQDAVTNEKKHKEKAIAYLTLSEYYLLFGKPDRARECLEKARGIAGSVKDRKARRTLTALQGYASDIYTYYVKYAGERR